LRGFDRHVGLIGGDAPGHTSRRNTAQRQTHRRGRNPNPNADLTRRQPRLM
jgi:hypothetical protein